MSEAEILENNRIIAVFMGARFGKKLSKYNEKIFLRDLYHYHDDWNLLIPVVEKIESVGYGVTIDSCVCEIYKHGRDYATKVADTKLSATYQAVCEFIKQQKI